MKRVSSRWILPLGNLVLAPLLIWWGEYQRAVFLARMEADANIFGITAPVAHSNYVPFGTQLCTALNAPAQLAALVLTDRLPQSPLLYRTMFLAFVFLVWWMFGRRLDGAPVATQGPERFPFAIVELTFGSVLLAGTLVTNWGTTPVAHVGVAAWSLFMIASAFARIRRTAVHTGASRVPLPSASATMVSTGPDVVPEAAKDQAAPAKSEPGENPK